MRRRFLILFTTALLIVGLFGLNAALKPEGLGPYARAWIAVHTEEPARSLYGPQCAVRQGYVSVTGGRVWYRIVGSGNGIPLIALHGGPGGTHDYLEPLESLCAERPVILYDQLGSGRSDRPSDKSLWRTERFVEELGQLRATLSLRRVHMLGQSWGTMLLTDYMLTRPQGVESIVMSDPSISEPKWLNDAKRYKKQLSIGAQEILARYEHTTPRGIDGIRYQAAVMEYYRAHVCRVTFSDSVLRTLFSQGTNVYETMWGPNEFTATGNLKDYDRSDRLQSIKAPTLFLCGRTTKPVRNLRSITTS